MDNGGSQHSAAQIVASYVTHHLRDGLLVLCPTGALLECNHAAHEILGPDPLGALMTAVDDAASWSRFVAQVSEGGRTTLLVAPESRPEFALRIEAVAMSGHLVVQVRDARTDRQRESELERVRRSDATGQLAMRVVHDMNNILTPILCMSTLLLAALDSGSPTSTYAREIEDAAQRAVDLAREMREFLRKSVGRDLSKSGEPDESDESADAE